MGLLDEFSDLTLNIQEATEDSDLIKVNPYVSPEVTGVHGVQTGVTVDKYIPILGQFDDIGQIDPGNCDTNSFEDALPVSEKLWQPKLVSARLSLCADDIPARLKFWIGQQKASKRWEQISNPLKQFILDRTGEAVLRAILRIADFGDTEAADVDNEGSMTSGATTGLFTMVDGVWKQIFDDDAGDGEIVRYTISENSEATKALQLALDDETAYETFKALVVNLPPEAMGNMNVIQCTKTLWDNWVAYVENKAGAYRPELLQDGTNKFTFRGFPVVVRPDWDRLIKKYFDLGDSYYLPHRAYMTDINNIPIGTSDTESFNALDSFYDKKDKKHYTDVAFKIDSKLLLEDSISVAY